MCLRIDFIYKIHEGAQCQDRLTGWLSVAK